MKLHEILLIEESSGCLSFETKKWTNFSYLTETEKVNKEQEVS